VPNAPKTPTRTIRVSDAIWDAVKLKAAEEKRTVTDVIVSALREYLKKEQE
jgi:hypothetical protein